MANSKSARKRIRQNEVRRVRNARVRTRVRTFTNGFLRAVDSGDVEQAEEGFRKVESELSRAAAKGVIPKKRASRKTGRLEKRLNALREQA